MDALTDVSGQLAIDANALAGIRRQARDDPHAALKSASQQFEAAFLQMVLKAMRDATPKDGLFDNEQTQLYQALLDQQLAQTLSTKGSTGLAALIEKQLGRGLPAPAQDPEKNAATTGSVSLSPAKARERVGVRGTAIDTQPLTPFSSSPQGGEMENVPAPAREFVSRLWPSALEASRATGIPAHFMIAQAALETGWGKSEPRRADGAPSYNLFGIKAGRLWNGPVAEAVTTEYVNGTAQKTVARFRAYGSYAEAFRDYANLLVSNPRYAEVLNQQVPSGFARSLQQAGYATDPMYADKLTRIIGGQALRAGLTG